jgi:hypothetical protein
VLPALLRESALSVAARLTVLEWARVSGLDRFFLVDFLARVTMVLLLLVRARFTGAM